MRLLNLAELNHLGICWADKAIFLSLRLGRENLKALEALGGGLDAVWTRVRRNLNSCQDRDPRAEAAPALPVARPAPRSG